MELVNRTSFAAQLMNFAPGVSGATPRWSLIAKGTFALRPSGGAVVPAARPSPLAVSDVPPTEGDPAVLPPRYESDFVPFKPRADCLCVGTAHPPGGASAGCVVSFAVGKHFDKSILVVGDRQWVAKLGGLRVGATEPAMFRAMPVTYENAYGGQDESAKDMSAAFAPNPSGKGYAISGKTAVGRPLPNLEDPVKLLRGWSDRVEPRAFGPVGRMWQPRLGWAGTYDERWQRERAPRLPVDFSEHYYNAAPDDQQVEGYLRGDEEVRLTNLHPAHSTLTCRLPGVRLRAFAATAPPSAAGPRYVGPSLREVTMNLDTLWVDAEALRLILVWRARWEPQPGDARVLLVEEPVEAPRPAANVYGNELIKIDAEAARRARREAELEREAPAEAAEADDEDV